MRRLNFAFQGSLKRAMVLQKNEIPDKKKEAMFNRYVWVLLWVRIFQFFSTTQDHIILCQYKHLQERYYKFQELSGVEKISTCGQREVTHCLFHKKVDV